MRRRRRMIAPVPPTPKQVLAQNDPEQELVDEDGVPIGTDAREGVAKYTTNVDTMDKELFSSLVKMHPHMMAQMGKQSQPFRDLMTDGFGIFYKYAPKILDEVPEARSANAQVIESVMGLPEYQHLRAFSRGDEINAVGALIAVEEAFKKLPKEVRDGQNKVDSIQKDLDDLLDKGDPADVPEAEKKVKDKQVAQKKLQKSLKNNAGKIRRIVRKELQKAQEEVDANQELSEAFGWGTGVGTETKVSLQERMKLAHKVHSMPDLHKLARLAGRMIAIAERKQSEKVEYIRTEVEGIELGNILADVVPEEFIKLEDPDLEDIFYKDFLDAKLTQYELRGTDSKGQGPVFVALDSSGSMTGMVCPNGEESYSTDAEGNPTLNSNVYSREQWAKAVGIALLSIAVKQKRDYVAVLFDYVVGKKLIVPKGTTPTVKDLEIFFGAFTGGGTSFDPPLREYLSHLENQKDSDCIFISDGDCQISGPVLAHFNNERERLKFDVFPVFIGDSLDEEAYGVQELSKLGKVMHVPRDKEDTILSNLFSI